ncbi:MAG: 16S rRNA (cytosine(967)-C(5))-methyltransferase RsmB [Proteobacteria bacterium]|jgi:16S rRNA (cytosine967-C5)-methyltransferase|nr:16S rRNA (cytosine(967)-C(5))-methyltransferase RsmB [Pseudomonadota bacterium]
MTPRLAAVHALTAVLGDGRSLTDALEPLLAEFPEPRDRALVQALAYGVLRDYPRLEAIGDHLMDKPLRARDIDIKLALHTGLYQIIAMRVPDHAAVAETVGLAGKLKKPWARSLLNGVLRQFLRQQNAIMNTVGQDEIARTAHPAWLLEQLKLDWPDDWEAITTANNIAGPMTLRVNTRQQDRGTYQARLAASGIEAVPAPFTECGLTLHQAIDIDDLPGFNSGAVSVQDAAAQLAAPLLMPQPGDRILDACAAPGGKTAHLLESQPDIGELLALDLKPARVQRLRDALDRLGLTANCQVGDAADPATWWDGKPFDRILLDAPCSASGVIRRHPDIKLLRRPDDIPRLADTQQQILHALWPLLRPGGMLLYVTCSVLRQENTHQVEQFLADRPDARLQDISADWGRPMPAGRQILPGENDMDGFYYACISKHA